MSKTTIRGADPAVIRVDGNYFSVESLNGAGIGIRQALSTDKLQDKAVTTVWSDTAGWGEVWAPEIFYDGGRFYIYFTAGAGNAHRMYMISSASKDPTGGYGEPIQMELPDNQWAIDGTMFTYMGQRYFVWSGWEGDAIPAVEQNLYIAQMSSPTTTTGPRSIISQPREPWERVTPPPGVNLPFVNEGPEAIQDPNHQLHIVYSANGSWSDQYCLADLRLRVGGNPMYVWDWYKSNGCLFGSPQNPKDQMMPGWDPTQNVTGPGHHSFVLLNGDINTSPPAGPTFPLMFHGVPVGTPYSWANRYWYTGTFCWWGKPPNGDITYSRANVPGDPTNTGWSLKFFE